MHRITRLGDDGIDGVDAGAHIIGKWGALPLESGTEVSQLVGKDSPEPVQGRLRRRQRQRWERRDQRQPDQGSGEGEPREAGHVAERVLVPQEQHEERRRGQPPGSAAQPLSSAEEHADAHDGGDGAQVPAQELLDRECHPGAERDGGDRLP